MNNIHPAAAIASQQSGEIAMTKEEAYDAKINPLMAQIIAVCKEHKIPLLASFNLGDDFHCSTTLLEESWGPSEEQIEAMRVLFPPKRSPLMLATRNGKGEVTSIEAII